MVIGELMTVCVLAEGQVRTFDIVHLVVTVAVGLGLTWLGVRQRRMEKLEERIENSAKELVATQIALASAGLQTTAASLGSQLGGVIERLSRGEGEFKGLVTADHHLEIKFTERVAEMRDELKDFIRDNCAMKSDCATKDQLTAVSEQVKGLSTQMSNQGARRQH